MFTSHSDSSPSPSLFDSFLADRQVASVCDSSRFAVRAVCRQVPFRATSTLVEFGPGRGVMTRELLMSLPPAGRLIAIESNQALADALLQTNHDHRLEVVHGSACDISAICRERGVLADVVVSGIPFSLLEDNAAQALIGNTAQNLAANGRFIIYQAWIPPIRDTRGLRRMLERNFRIIETERVLRNFPPLEVLTGIRR